MYKRSKNTTIIAKKNKKDMSKNLTIIAKDIKKPQKNKFNQENDRRVRK